MTQTARPIADTNISGMTDENGGGSNLFAVLDEASADDADFIRSTAAPTGDVYVCLLDELIDPLSSANHVVHYRYSKQGTTQVDLLVELRMHYSSEASQGTLIASWTHTDIPTAWTQADQTLSAGEADAITDYTDLYLRFVFS